MDVEGYLARFIDIEYILPSSNIDLYVNYLFEKLDIRKLLLNKGIESFYELLNKESIYLFKSFDFSLRIQKKVLTRFVIIMNTISKSKKIYPELLLFLLCLKYKDSDVFKEAINGELTYTYIMKNIFNALSAKEYFSEEDNLGYFLESALLHVYGDKEDIDLLNKSLEKYNKLSEEKDRLSQEENMERYRLLNILDSYKRFKNRYSINYLLEYLKNKIEIYENFIINES